MAKKRARGQPESLEEAYARGFADGRGIAFGEALRFVREARQRGHTVLGLGLMMHLFAAGELVRDPERKTAKNGNTYATALMREGEAVITVTAFDRELAERLLTLEKGDPLAVAGRLTVSAYLDKQEEPKAGLQVTATRLMAAPARMSSAHETP